MGLCCQLYKPTPDIFEFDCIICGIVGYLGQIRLSFIFEDVSNSSLECGMLIIYTYEPPTIFVIASVFLMQIF